jgi:hypothetical protein
MDDREYLSDDDPGADPPYEWLDEWLCEYVDGTMDPALEIVFEEYVEANPDLKAHVERLQETRQLLCDCGQEDRTPDADAPSPKKVQAPQRVKARVCGKVECEMLRSQAPVASVLRENPVATIGAASSVVALVVGLFVGAALFAPSPLAESGASTAAPTTTVDADGDAPATRRAPQRPLQQMRRTPAEALPFSRLQPASGATAGAGMTHHIDTTHDVSRTRPSLMRVGTP